MDLRAMMQADKVGRTWFRFYQPHGGYYGSVQQAAVLWCLGGRPGAGSFETAVRAATAAVVDINRTALAKRVGDGSFTSTAEYLRYYNCRPAFVRLWPRTNFCDRAMICPHCWARQAGESWKHVDGVLFPLSGSSRLPVFPFDVVAVRRVFENEALAVYRARDGAIDLAAAFHDRCQPRKSGRGRLPSRVHEMRGLSARGFLDLTLAMPVRDKEEKDAFRWRIVIRQLFVVPAGQPLDLQWTRVDDPRAQVSQASLRRLETPSRRQVAAMLGWLWRFPVGLLRVGTERQPPPTVLVEQYLAAREGRHLFAAGGIFRRKHAAVSNIGHDDAAADIEED